MTYDLARLAAHGFIERDRGTHRYRLTADGLRIATFLTKLNDRILAPGLARVTATAPPAQQRWASFERVLAALCADAQLAS